MAVFSGRILKKQMSGFSYSRNVHDDDDDDCPVLPFVCDDVDVDGMTFSIAGKMDSAMNRSECMTNPSMCDCVAAAAAKAARSSISSNRRVAQIFTASMGP
jgi:hypothetical protein